MQTLGARAVACAWLVAWAIIIMKSTLKVIVECVIILCKANSVVYNYYNFKG